MKRIGELKFREILINKQLEKYNITFNEIKNKYPDLWIDDLYWYEYYTFTPGEAKLFKEWFYEFMEVGTDYLLTQEEITKIFENFYLHFGLRIKK